MFAMLERQQRLTGNQRRIVLAAILGGMLEFFDYFLIGFVLAFIVSPWKLTYLDSAIILLSSGIGAMIGAGAWGWLADRIGRRKVFIATVINFSVATSILALTPDRGWIFLTVFRFFVGFGVGGLYCVDLPLVQEFMPSSKRGLVGGIVTAAIPLGVGLGAVLGAYLTPFIGWRGLFAVGLLPAALTLLIRAWVPESPRWLTRMGRPEEARQSLAWALEIHPKTIALPARVEAQRRGWLELFRHPRSLVVSWLGNLGMQTGIYGLTLWVPTLFTQLLGVSPKEAARLMILVSLGGFAGRVVFAYLSDAIGRRRSGGLLGFGAAVMVVITAYMHGAFIGTVSSGC
jgi:MFS transporter, putative metabolite:H+ symporter